MPFWLAIMALTIPVFLQQEIQGLITSKTNRPHISCERNAKSNSHISLLQIQEHEIHASWLVTMENVFQTNT